jgi:hypothetical protein
VKNKFSECNSLDNKIVDRDYSARVCHVFMIYEVDFEAGFTSFVPLLKGVEQGDRLIYHVGR